MCIITILTVEVIVVVVVVVIATPTACTTVAAGTTTALDIIPHILCVVDVAIRHDVYMRVGWRIAGMQMGSDVANSFEICWATATSVERKKGTIA